MNRKILFYALVILPIVVFADTTIALDAFKHYRELYEQGQYKNAMQGFQICIDKFRNDPIFIENCRKYIRQCETQLTLIKQKQLECIKKEKAAEVERELAAQRGAEQERITREEKERKRLEDNLIFVSSDAYLFDENINLHSAVERALSDAGFEQTDDPEKAHWTVFITAMAYEDQEENITTRNGTEKIYWSNVNALVKIEDNVKDKLVFEGDIKHNDNKDFSSSGTSYKDSAQRAYRKLEKELSPLIVNKLKNRQL